MIVTVGSLTIEIKTKGMDEAKRGLDDMARNSSAAEAAFGQLARKAESLTNTLERAARAFITFESFKWAKDVSLLAARYETLGVTMRLAGANAGVSAAKMMELEKSLKSQGIAAIEAREQLTKMAASGIDLAKAGELARAAQDVAVVGGINSSEAFQRLVYGIQSAQVEVLRTIGLNVNFEDSYKKLAKELDKTTGSLTQQEKLQARINATLEQSAKYNGLYEASMRTAGKQITSLTRYWSDFKVELGNSQLLVVTQIVERMTNKLKELTEEVKKPEVQERLAKMGDSFVRIFDDGTRAMGIVGGVITKAIDGWNSLPELIREYGLIGAVLGGTKAKLIFGGIGIGASYLKGTAYKGEGSSVEDQVKQLQRDIQQMESSGEFGMEEAIAKAKERLGSLMVGHVRESALQQGKNMPADSWLLKDWGAPQVALPTPDAAEAKDKNADKIKHARESITARLERMNDSGEGAESRMSSLRKEYAHFIEVLGKGDPLVKQFAEHMAYAEKHGGHTEDQVKKVTLEAKERVTQLESEISNLQQTTDSKGNVDQEKLRVLNAITKAEEKYRDSLRDGVEETIALREKELSVQKAQLEATQQNEQVQQQFLQTAAGVLKNRADLQEKLLENEMELLRRNVKDKVLLAEYEAQRRLDASRKATDGITRAYQSWSDDATNMAKGFGDMFTNGMNNSSEVVAQFCRTGKLNFRGMVNSWLDDMARLASRQMTSSIFGSILGAVGSAAGSYFGGGLGGGTGGAASGAWGDYADRVVGIAGTRASGGPVLGGNTYLVGENGPELFTPDLAGAIVPNAALAGGAASDNRVLDALASLKDAITSMGGSGSPRIVNVLDQSLVHEAMASSGGEKVILNFIRSNAGAVKAALGTA